MPCHAIYPARMGSAQGTGSGVTGTETGPIVFADNGSPAADLAWLWLISHRWTGWQLRAMTAHDTLFPGSSRREVRDVPRQPPDEAGFAGWDHIYLEGDPRVVLAQRSDAAFLVLGCRHRSHVAGVLAGSTVEWLLVRPPVPLLVARHGRTTRSALICVDGSQDANRAVATFLSFPWSAEVAVTLLTVNDGVSDAVTSLRDAAALFPEHPAPARQWLVGSPHHVIPPFAHSRGFDLVVLGTRGRTGLRRQVLGSTVASVLRDTDANLLVASDPDSWA